MKLERSNWRRWGRTAVGGLAIGLTGLAVLVLAAWLLGRVLSDRWGWSQWLLWIPTEAALAAAALGAVGASRPTRRPGVRRRRVLGWAAVGSAILVYFSVFEHRFLRLPGRGGSGPRLVQWSIHTTGPRFLRRHAEALVGLDADLTVVSTLLPIHGIHRLLDDLEGLGQGAVSWPFILLSRWPILEARPLIARADIRASVFRVDTTEPLGRPLTIYAIDLPSKPTRPRAEIAREVRRLLDSIHAAAPDIVIGDFNMTRGSASLDSLFPGFEHAYDQAGWGYGASFRQDFPLYHIDHALLADTVRAVDYDLVNPGFGRHLIQVVQLAPAEQLVTVPDS